MQLYITRAEAVKHGATHEATLDGVPLWCVRDTDGVLMGRPKLKPLQLWLNVVDFCYEIAAYFLPEDRCFKLDFKNVKEL